MKPRATRPRLNRRGSTESPTHEPETEWSLETRSTTRLKLPFLPYHSRQTIIVRASKSAMPIGPSQVTPSFFYFCVNLSVRRESEKGPGR